MDENWYQPSNQACNPLMYSTCVFTSNTIGLCGALAQPLSVLGSNLATGTNPDLLPRVISEILQHSSVLSTSNNELLGTIQISDMLPCHCAEYKDVNQRF